jgi:hypothetical protein
MAADNISLLVDAKTEYTNQLVGLLTKPLYEGFKSLFDDAVSVCNENNQEGAELKTFQNLLGRIPQWNQEIIDNECERIKITCKCEWIEDLISAVFVSHTRVLTNMNAKNKISLSIPKLSKFIHKVYINIARQFWKNPFLFSYDGISQFEYQKNIRECEMIISESIHESIRLLLPVKNILKEYLGGTNSEQPDTDEILEDSDITSDNYQTEHIKKMIENDTFLKNIILEDKSSKESDKKSDFSIEKSDDISKTDPHESSPVNDDKESGSTEIKSTEIESNKTTNNDSTPEKESYTTEKSSDINDDNNIQSEKKAVSIDNPTDAVENSSVKETSPDTKLLPKITKNSLPTKDNEENVTQTLVNNLKLDDLAENKNDDVVKTDILEKCTTIDNIDLSSLPSTEISQHLHVENIPIEEEKPSIDTLDISSIPAIDSQQSNLHIEDLNPPPSPEITLDNIDLDSIPVNNEHDLKIEDIVESPKSAASPISLNRNLDFDSITKHNQLDYNSYQNIVNQKNIKDEVLNEINKTQEKEHSFF